MSSETARLYERWCPDSVPLVLGDRLGARASDSISLELQGPNVRFLKGTIDRQIVMPSDNGPIPLGLLAYELLRKDGWHEYTTRFAFSDSSYPTISIKHTFHPHDQAYNGQMSVGVTIGDAIFFFKPEGIGTNCFGHRMVNNSLVRCFEGSSREFEHSATYATQTHFLRVSRSSGQACISVGVDDSLNRCVQTVGFDIPLVNSDRQFPEHGISLFREVFGGLDMSLLEKDDPRVSRLLEWSQQPYKPSISYCPYPIVDTYLN